MESEIVWDKFRTPGLLEPYIVHFPNYTKGELCVCNKRRLVVCFMFELVTETLPLPSNRHHRGNGDCLEGKRENYQVCSEQFCVQQLCTVQCTHI